MNTKIFAIAIAAIIIVGGAGYTYPYLSTVARGSGYSTYTVMLTDPPSVPSGTQAVNINLYAVEVHINNGSWLSSTLNQQINLLQLVNVTKVIAEFKIPDNSTVTQIRLYISNATIVINGSTHVLFVPSDVIKITVTNSTGMTGTLVDLHTHIVETHAFRSIRYILTPVVSAKPFNKQTGHGLNASLLLA